MKKTEKQKNIVKFINQEANHSELEGLNTWLEKKKEDDVFNDLVKVEYLVAMSTKNYDVDKAKHKIKTKIAKKKRKQRILFLRKLSIAVSVLLLFGVAFFQYINKTEDVIQQVKNSEIITVGSNKAILTLNNGEEVALEKDKNYVTEKLKSNGSELRYSQDGKEKTALAYNYLTVPKGGEFFIALADGTKVWLNSDSKLKYPVQFISGESRKIELVYGEAYLEVSPSSAHGGDAFHVITKNQQIDVLGTHFNIKAYKEDEAIATTLVEGKVRVTNGFIEKILKPSQQSIIKNTSKAIKVVTVDVTQEIAWVKGMFSFNEISLSEMMTVLSRWYNVDVVFESEKSKNYSFTGVLERTRTIEEILEIIAGTGQGEVAFKIKERTIIIK